MRSLTNVCAAAILLGSMVLVSGCRDNGIPNIKQPERISDMSKVILSGVMAKERDPRTGYYNEVVFKIDTGEKFVLFNPAYNNTLREQVGKRVKLRGSLGGPTTFKGFRGFIVDDILEVQK